MDLRASLLAAVRHLMIPLARILVRNGVGFAEFAEASRYAFVEAGTSVLKERGLAATSARVAVNTGLTRRDIERVMGDPERFAIHVSKEWNGALQVLHAWHTRPPFVLVPVGIPMELDYDMPHGKLSFVSLVRTAAPDADPARILEFLSEVRAIERDEHGRYRPLTRYVIPEPRTEHQIRWVARTARRFLDTIELNITQDPKLGRFERSVTADRGIPVDQYDEFVAFIRKTMLRALEDIDDWIADNARGQSDQPLMWPGVGMYHWLDNPEDPQFPIDYALSAVKPTKN